MSDTVLDQDGRDKASIGLSPSHGVMEGDGAYNRHAMIQAGAAALATPLLEKALREIALGGDEQPVVIADYGSSQGKNSLGPMRVAIQNLRTRIGPNPAHLFAVLNSDPERYVLGETNAPVRKMTARLRKEIRFLPNRCIWDGHRTRRSGFDVFPH